MTAFSSDSQDQLVFVFLDKGIIAVRKIKLCNVLAEHHN